MYTHKYTQVVVNELYEQVLMGLRGSDASLSFIVCTTTTGVHAFSAHEISAPIKYEVRPSFVVLQEKCDYVSYALYLNLD